jgi:hypothetical protein
MVTRMITLNEDQALQEHLGNLRIECIVGTEDGSFVVYYDQTTKELILSGHWVLIAGDDDLPDGAFRPRPLFGRGRTLLEASATLMEVYSKNFWKSCRICYLRPHGSFERELFGEWKKLGLSEFDTLKHEFCNNTPSQIHSSYESYLDEK